MCTLFACIDRCTKPRRHNAYVLFVAYDVFSTIDDIARARQNDRCVRFAGIERIVRYR